MGKFLVTGCAGFIGSHLCDRLIAEGHDVVGIDNFDPFYDRSIKEQNIAQLMNHDSFQLIEGDICDDHTWNLLATEKFDCVFHLAAKAGVRPSILNPQAYTKTNIIGTQKLLDWMVKSSNKRLIFASSSSVYGNNEKVPFSENDNVDFPISPYAFTKKSCELMIHTYSHLYNIHAVCLRFFTVYGPRQRPDLAIHKFMKAIYNGEHITLFGDGSTSRDYTYIEDIINGISKAVESIDKLKFEIVNIGGENPIKLIDLVFAINKVLEKKADIQFTNNQPGDVTRTYADLSKSKELLNHEPKTPIHEGLQKFYDWVLRNKNS
jgi:UDP-glucuronate 4-epimerase